MVGQINVALIYTDQPEQFRTHAYFLLVMMLLLYGFVNFSFVNVAHLCYWYVFMKLFSQHELDYMFYQFCRCCMLLG